MNPAILLTTLILVTLSFGCGSTDAVGDFASGAIHGLEYSEEARVKYNEAVDFQEKGLHLKAMEAADETIQLAPDWAFPYYLRAKAQYDMKQYSMAKKDFDKTIELDSSNELSLSDVYMTRGANFMGLGDNQAAIQDLDKAIELNEDNAYAYNARAMILLELGQSELSKKDSARACELDRLLC